MAENWLLNVVRSPAPWFGFQFKNPFVPGGYTVFAPRVKEPRRCAWSLRSGVSSHVPAAPCPPRLEVTTPMWMLVIGGNSGTKGAAHLPLAVVEWPGSGAPVASTQMGVTRRFTRSGTEAA